MSFAEKLSGLMARPGQDTVPKDDVPWWMKIAGRGMGTVGGFLFVLVGLWNCVSILLIDVACLLTGLWQMVTGFVVITCEAPCCCIFVDFVQKFSDMVENRPYWNRAVFYIIVAIPPIIFCRGLSTFLACGLIFGTGVVYGMMSLGKKATMEEMRSSAAQVNTGAPSSSQTADSNMRSNLVQNAAPMSFTGVPAFDSNV